MTTKKGVEEKRKKLKKQHNMTDDIDNILANRLKELPEVVQSAIMGASVQQHLRALADTHKLHLDQWQVLENEVVMTLMGLQPADELESNIQREVEVDAAMARTLATDIALNVFEPIRKELERQLEHPDAEEAPKASKNGSDNVPASQEEIITAAKPKVRREGVPVAYASGQPSSERTGSVDAVNADPYRESVE